MKTYGFKANENGAPVKGEFFESWSVNDARIEERNDTVARWFFRIMVVVLALAAGWLWVVNIPTLF